MWDFLKLEEDTKTSPYKQWVNHVGDKITKSWLYRQRIFVLTAQKQTHVLRLAKESGCLLWKKAPYTKTTYPHGFIRTLAKTYLNDEPQVLVDTDKTEYLNFCNKHHIAPTRTGTLWHKRLKDAATKISGIDLHVESAQKFLATNEPKNIKTKMKTIEILLKGEKE